MLRFDHCRRRPIPAPEEACGPTHESMHIVCILPGVNALLAGAAVLPKHTVWLVDGLRKEDESEEREKLDGAGTLIGASIESLWQFPRRPVRRDGWSASVTPKHHGVRLRLPLLYFLYTIAYTCIRLMPRVSARSSARRREQHRQEGARDLIRGAIRGDSLSIRCKGRKR
jgi:hypothetical protein